MIDKLLLSGRFKGEHWRLINGRLVKIDEWFYKNGITNVGKNYVLDTAFVSGTPITAWHMGLIDASGYTALAAADTMLSHTGWAEFTNYSESARPAIPFAAASGQQITHPSPIVFTITAAGTLKGGFVTSGSVKGATAGTLWSTALYSADRAVVIADVIRNTYTLGT